jgi:hypothetical protein
MVKGLKRLNEILSLKISYLAYKLICIFLICQFLFLPFSQQALAFDAQTTHRILTEKALRIKVEKHKATGDTDFLKAFGDINEEGKLILTPEARKIIDGSEEEDYPEPRFINFV